MLTLQIAGTDRTGHLRVNTARVSRSLNGRASMSCELEGTGAYRPLRGQEIKILDGTTVVFGGHISRVIEKQHPGGVAGQWFEVEARDYSHILNRRLVTGTFSGWNLGQILQFVVDQFLASEGITVSVDSPPPLINETLVFFYETAAAVMNKLSTVTGLLWYVDFNKVLHFSSLTANPAPISLSDTSANWRNLEVETSDEDYRNRQHVRTEIPIGATAGSSGDTITEDPVVMVAGQDNIPLKGSIVVVHSVTINNIPKTFIELTPFVNTPADAAGYDFYYWKGGIALHAADWGPATGGEVARVRYTPGGMLLPPSQDPNNTSAPGVKVITVDDTSAQAARKAIEGGSGIWEAIEEQRNIASVPALQAIAEGRLRQYAQDKTTIRFETDASGLKPGQRISINIPRFGLNGSYLIESCKYEWVASLRGDFLRTSVECTPVEPYGNPIGYMERLVESMRIGAGSGGSSTVVTGGGGSGLGRSIVREWPSGVADGTNTQFTLSYVPVPPEGLFLFLNGVYQRPGIDYNLTGQTIIYTLPPHLGDTHIAVYFTDGTPGTPLLNLARYFPGTDSDRLLWGHHDQFRLLGDMSFGCWVKFDPALTNGVIVGYGYSWFLSGGDQTDLYPYGLKAVKSGGTCDIYYVHDNSPTSHPSHTFNTDLQPDTWYYIGFSRSDPGPAGVVELFVSDGNGIYSAGQFNYMADPHPSAATSSRSQLQIGCRLGTNPQWPPDKMTVQQHYLWSRPLSISEHLLAAKGSPPIDGAVLIVRQLGNSPENDNGPYGFSGTVTGTTVVGGH